MVGDASDGRRAYCNARSSETPLDSNSEVESTRKLSVIVRLKDQIIAKPARDPWRCSREAQHATVTEKEMAAPMSSSRTASHRPTAVKQIKETEA